jgi:hypothetical protein
VVLLSDSGGDSAVLVGMFHPQLVSLGRQLVRCQGVVLVEKDAQLPRKPLQEQKQEKHVGLLAPGA